MVLAVIDVERFAFTSLEPDGEFDGTDHVGHVGEVTTLVAVFQNLDGLILRYGTLE